MQYYDNSSLPELINYFKAGIEDENKNIGHCILFWGADIKNQCEIALEIARLYNCSEKGAIDCECTNCKWIREQTHPAVKIYTRLDFKESAGDEEDHSSGKKNISVSQAKSIIKELTVSSDYHRVYIFCDRDEDGNLLPLNKFNFPEATSNSLLKTFEEPPSNTTFFFLTKDKSDVISTVVSRCQSFFVPSCVKENSNYDLVENLFKKYPNIAKDSVLDLEQEVVSLSEEHGLDLVLTQIQNYMLVLLKSNFGNKKLFYKILNDIENIETAKRQNSLTPSMNTLTIIENLCFKMVL